MCTSLDTLDPFKFEIITRRRGHDAVLKSLNIASSLPLASLKINVVVIKGLNDMEVLDFVEMTKDRAISVRFIEFMPFTGTFDILSCILDLLFAKAINGKRRSWFPLRFYWNESKTNSRH
jgi:molybdenum cofactor biosynthesis enzyme MoaA